ncbi:YncE family protein [Salegentibacter chungangensis]|uniref:YncE family protein n=1 Tax=Salegentibacter chungangensis TaxID=1335724 RepID=A0ABW3NTW6_9FLAO
MNIKKLLFLGLTTVFAFTSCEKESSEEIPQPEVEGDYASGAFVLNEGNFGSGNSSISFLNEDMTGITHHIFTEENQVELLGDTGQDIGFYEDYAFIVLNVSNKIEVVDRNSFERIGTIDSGLLNPRFISFANGKAYVTNWGDGTNPDDDFIAVINPENLEIIKNISVSEGPDQIVSANGKLYVAHPGGFSISNKLSVINSASDEVEKQVEVGEIPNSLEVSGNSLWIACSGKPAYSGEETAGSILRMDLGNGEIAEKFQFAEATAHPSNLELNDVFVYYTLGTQVYSFDQNDTSLPETPFMSLEEAAVLYGFEVADGLIFAASANADFTGDGDLYIYDATTGNLLNSFKTGINPNGIFFSE